MTAREFSAQDLKTLKKLMVALAILLTVLVGLSFYAAYEDPRYDSTGITAAPTPEEAQRLEDQGIDVPYFNDHDVPAVLVEGHDDNSLPVVGERVIDEPLTFGDRP